MKVIDYKKIRDEWLKQMVEFQKLGDTEKAQECLKMAAHVNMLRTEIEPIITSDTLI